MSEPRPNVTTIYAAQAGSRIVLASSSRSVAMGFAEANGYKLAIGFFLPQTGVPVKRRTTSDRYNAPLKPAKGAAQLTVREVAELKGLASADSVRYAIRTGQLPAKEGARHGSNGKMKSLIKRSDAEAWEPSPKFKRAK